MNAETNATVFLLGTFFLVFINAYLNINHKKNRGLGQKKFSVHHAEQTGLTTQKN